MTFAFNLCNINGSVRSYVRLGDYFLRYKRQKRNIPVYKDIVFMHAEINKIFEKKICCVHIRYEHWRHKNSMLIVLMLMLTLIEFN